VAERGDDPRERMRRLLRLGDDLDPVQRRRGRPLVRPADCGRLKVRLPDVRTTARRLADVRTTAQVGGRLGDDEGVDFRLG
jgi:hypothetical protein